VPRLLICGLIRDSEKIVADQVDKFRKAFANLGNLEFLFVESDSKDRTLEVVTHLASLKGDIKVISLGKLESFFPNRIERIRRCRNEYVSYIRKNINEYDYVVVADMDGINSRIRSSGIDSCFTSKIHWDMCSANQTHGYYDIYALRARGWCESDFMRDLEILGIGMDKKNLFKLRSMLIYDRMHKINRRHGWIKVESAFGGLAIYRSEVFQDADYSAVSDSNSIQCEHVDFHSKLIAQGKNLYINPRMINSSWNTYNINRIPVIRRIRKLRRNIFNFYNK
jgi:hypothetical protein